MTDEVNKEPQGQQNNEGDKKNGLFLKEFPFLNVSLIIEKVKPLVEKLFQFLSVVLQKLKPYVTKYLTLIDNFLKQHAPWVIPFRKPIIVALILLFFSFLIVPQFFSKREGIRPTKPEAPGKGEMKQGEGGQEDVAVKVFPVKRFNYEDSLKALGSIKGAIEFKLSFEIPGIVNSINYREGEHYEEGALLMSLKQDDILLNLKRSQAQSNKAQTTLKIAQEKLKEHEKLFDIGAIPRSTLDQIKLELESAQYEAEASQLEVKAQESMLEKTNLYAVSDGMIGELNIEEGEAVTQQTLIGTHVFTEYVLVEFGVVEREVNKLALGQKARVFIDAYPDKTFEGTVENISPVVAGTSRTATVRVRVENPEGLLLPGMFARVKILIYSKKNTFVVPTEAVLGKKEEAYVFVIDAQTNIASKKSVKVGYQREDYSQIDSGLTEGDLVVIHGYEKLEEGSKVKVLEKQELQL